MPKEIKSEAPVEIRIQCTASEAEDLLKGLTVLAEDGQIDGVKNVSVEPAKEGK